MRRKKAAVTSLEGAAGQPYTARVAAGQEEQQRDDPDLGSEDAIPCMCQPVFSLSLSFDVPGGVSQEFFFLMSCTVADYSLPGRWVLSVAGSRTLCCQ